MRFKIGLLLIMMIALVGCGARDVERNAIGTANENLKVIGDHLTKKPETNPEGRIVKAQTRVIDRALDLTEEEMAKVTPTVSTFGLTTAPQEEADKADEDAEKLGDKVDEAQAAGFWGWAKSIFTWAGWGTVGMGLLWALHVASGFTKAGPLVQAFTGPILKRTPLVGRSIKDSETLKVADVTTESSTVGRFALRAADRVLGSKHAEEIASFVGTVTGGRKTTLEGLFTHFAEGHAIDHASVAHDAVRGYLEEVKTRMPTVAGIPTEVASLLDRPPPDGSG